MPALPNLYLKWHVFRELIGHPHADAQIADAIFGAEGGAIKFSKMLYGDLACAPEVAGELVNGVINRRIELYRKVQGLPAKSTQALTPFDLELSLYDFTRRLLAAVDDAVPADALERTHRYLLDQLAPRLAAPGPAPHLKIERYSREKMFEGVQPSGGGGPLEFKPGRDMGRLAIVGLNRDPVAAYVLFTRDPAGLNQRLWDLSWGETVAWLPSPFRPAREGGEHLLMDTQPVKAISGRFFVTAVLVMDGQALPALDLRARGAKPGALDEIETSRFLTGVRRLVKRKPPPIVVATNEYVVSA
jgi:hypothetical protein